MFRFSRITNPESRIMKEGRPAAALIVRLGWMAAAGCDPCLSFACESSGGRQVHLVLRCRQFRPQRRDQDSPTRLVVKRVDVRAPLAEPVMSHPVRVPCAGILLAGRSDAAGTAPESEEPPARQPFERCRTTRVCAFWAKIQYHCQSPFH